MNFLMDVKLKFQMIEWLVENTQIDKQSIEILRASPGDGASFYSDTIKLLGKGQDLPVEALKFLDKMSEAIMVVLLLIASMSFQAAITPPGGVWQDD